MTEHRTHVRKLTSLIRWTTARGLNTTLTTPKRPRQFAGSFLTEHDYTHHLRRCLTDGTLAREVQIMGALVLLYALPLSRIPELTTTQFRRTPEGAFLTLRRHPVLVPPRLALLIEEQIEDPGTGCFRRQLDDGTHHLLPGQAPGRARNPLGAGALLRSHGLPVLTARNTAMIEAATDLPPIVIADLFGLHRLSALSRATSPSRSMQPAGPLAAPGWERPVAWW
ncbi:hypothetical protein ACFCYC_24485 [Streptomyces sp. NPDC056402]|uniref:hypothetical protein n=1 Tax=Streptomyces sp. NPDC056402 TaxID=3345810 RepID=UPI0035E1F9E0